MAEYNKKIPPLWRAKPYGGWYLYVLLLERGRYYVGISHNPERRIRHHCGSRRGAAFTKHYYPVKNIYLKRLNTKNEDTAKDAENVKTLELMHKYGSNFVRGGDYVISYPKEKELASWQNKATIASRGVKILSNSKRNGKRVKASIIGTLDLG